MAENQSVIRTIRAPHERNYVVTIRASAQDERLTWEARGVLWYLLSKPDDWEVMIPDLQQQCGRDKVYRILRELAEYGYLVTEQTHDEKGRFTGTIYRVYETPFTENPYTGNPNTGQPLTGNPPLHNRESKKVKTPQKNTKTAADAARGGKPSKAEGEGSSPNGRKPRPADPIFEAIAKHIFDIEAHEIEDKDTRGHINGLAGVARRNFKSVYAAHFASDAWTPELLEKAGRAVQKFTEDWQRENPELSLPQAKGKFGTAFLKYIQNAGKAQPKKADTYEQRFKRVDSAGDVPQGARTTPEQRRKIREEMAQGVSNG